MLIITCTTSFGSAVGQAYWIGEEHHNQPQITTVAELSAIENPHEAEACFLPQNILIPYSDFGTAPVSHFVSFRATNTKSQQGLRN